NMATKTIHLGWYETLNPVRDTLEVFSGKWKLPILISGMAGNERFTDIQNSVGCITPKVLAKELKDLEEHQLIKRIVVDDYPVKILYKAEPYAKTKTTIIEVPKTWGQSHRKNLFAGGTMDEVESVLSAPLLPHLYL